MAVNFNQRYIYNLLRRTRNIQYIWQATDSCNPISDGDTNGRRLETDSIDK